jgi:IS30 family transposase
MMKTYKRLSAAEREIISQLLAQGKSCACIAQELRRSRSTITREVHLYGTHAVH